MPVPVKVSDRLLALAKEEGRGTHRSATAQIEHWATLGRAVETLLAYQDVLALKRTGQALPIPRQLGPQDVRDVLSRVLDDPDREAARARIRAGGGPVYQADPHDPNKVVAVDPDAATERRIAARTRKSRRSR